MAKKACAGLFEIGATPDAVGEMRAYRVTNEASEIDTTIMGACKTRMQPGPLTQTVETDLFFEYADPGQAAVLAALGSDTAQAIKLYPQGKGSGLPVLEGNAFVMNHNVEGEATGAIQVTATFSSDEDGLAWNAQV